MSEVGIVLDELGVDGSRVLALGGGALGLLDDDLGDEGLGSMGRLAPVLALDGLLVRSLRIIANRGRLVLEVCLGDAETGGLAHSTLVALRSRHGD